MLASSAFVLAALTMTGVYVKNNNEKTKNDGYNIDFSALEGNADDKYTEIKDKGQIAVPKTIDDDLDYMPMEQVDGGSVEIPGLTGNGTSVDNKEPLSNDAVLPEGELINKEEPEDETSDEEKDRAAIEADAEENKPTAGTATDVAKGHKASFTAGDSLVWPVTGNVLIPYSMDKTVYFSTLAQYKYNPALIIASEEGEQISASASGTVTSVFEDEVIGKAVKMSIGNGYEITYGQLKDIKVAKGDYVEKGGIVGYVAVPTMYYSVEGTNVYFALTLNGEPVDPMGQLE